MSDSEQISDAERARQMLALAGQSGQATTAEERRRRIETMRANFAQEGMQPDAEDLALQERYIEGTATLADLLAHAREYASTAQLRARENAVAQALATVRLEGGVVSARAVENGRRYVLGEIGIDEFLMLNGGVLVASDNAGGSGTAPARPSTPIEAFVDSTWQPLEFANETPVYPCRVGAIEGLLASAWLALHTDGAAYEQADRMQLITPYFIDSVAAPVLLVTRDGELVEQPLMLGAPFVVDLLAPHALLPRKWVDLVLQHGTDQFPEFQAWWEPLYDNEDVAPVFAWSSTRS